MKDSIETRFRFTDKRVRTLPANPAEARAREKEYSDTELTGLKVLVSKNLRRFFYLRIQRAGRKITRRLGEFGVIGVADARRMAAALRLEMESPGSLVAAGACRSSVKGILGGKARLGSLSRVRNFLREAFGLLL